MSISLRGLGFLVLLGIWLGMWPAEAVALRGAGLEENSAKGDVEGLLKRRPAPQLEEMLVGRLAPTYGPPELVTERTVLETAGFLTSAEVSSTSTSAELFSIVSVERGTILACSVGEGKLVLEDKDGAIVYVGRSVLEGGHGIDETRLQRSALNGRWYYYPPPAKRQNPVEAIGRFHDLTWGVSTVTVRAEGFPRFDGAPAPPQEWTGSVNEVRRAVMAVLGDLPHEAQVSWIARDDGLVLRLSHLPFPDPPRNVTISQLTQLATALWQRKPTADKSYESFHAALRELVAEWNREVGARISEQPMLKLFDLAEDQPLDRQRLQLLQDAETLLGAVELAKRDRDIRWNNARDRPPPPITIHEAMAKLANHRFAAPHEQAQALIARALEITGLSARPSWRYATLAEAAAAFPELATAAIPADIASRRHEIVIVSAVVLYATASAIGNPKTVALRTQAIQLLGRTPLELLVTPPPAWLNAIVLQNGGEPRPAWLPLEIPFLDVNQYDRFPPLLHDATAIFLDDPLDEEVPFVVPLRNGDLALFV